MRRLRGPWPPVAMLALGGALLPMVQAQTEPQLRKPLVEALPTEFVGAPGVDGEVTDDVAVVAGFTDYALRIYENPDSTAPIPWASAYVGFYDRQTQGRTIHSPRNCLPGSGWETLSHRSQDIEQGGTSFTVNRYVLQEGQNRALVLYWYQGRGRVAHNEYLVKWDLLRDAALKRRTDEALVRVVVPIVASEEDAFDTARELARAIKPELDRALPVA